MKIAYICSDRGPCPPVKGGAIQLYISKVAPIIAKRHSITVFSITDKKLPRKEKRKGVQYIRYSAGSFQRKVLKKLKSKGYDIVQIFNRPTLAKKVKEASPNSKVVLSLHNLFFGTDRLKDSEAKKCRENTDYVVTVSKFVADHLDGYGFKKSEIKPIYSGVDLKDYPKLGTKKWKQWKKTIRQKWKIPQKANVILFAGRLVPDKGCHVVVRSLKSILKEHPKTYLLVVGSKWYAEHERTPYIRKLYKEAKKLRHHVKFTSYIPVEKMPKYYSASDIFVCASQWEEPLARVHYEAMAAALPIVTTERGGNGEVINKGVNGYCLKDYKNPRAFSEAITSLLKDRKKARELGRNGRKLAERTYHFNRVARELLGIYKELMN